MVSLLSWKWNSQWRSQIASINDSWYLLSYCIILCQFTLHDIYEAVLVSSSFATTKWFKWCESILWNAFSCDHTDHLIWEMHGSQTQYGLRRINNYIQLKFKFEDLWCFLCLVCEVWMLFVTAIAAMHVSQMKYWYSCYLIGVKNNNSSCIYTFICSVGGLYGLCMHSIELFLSSHFTENLQSLLRVTAVSWRSSFAFKDNVITIFKTGFIFGKVLWDNASWDTCTAKTESSKWCRCWVWRQVDSDEFIRKYIQDTPKITQICKLCSAFHTIISA